MLELADLQNSAPDVSMPIDKVGVSDLHYPITVLDRKNQTQQTSARISMSVSVPRHFKGTHMSRFVEILNKHRGEITMRTIPDILHELKVELEADAAHMEVCFPYFVEKAAPVTGLTGLMDYECAFTGESNGRNDDFILSVRVPVTSLCPCSKAISEYGGHNQRGHITIGARSKLKEDGTRELVWIEELIDIAERSASAPVYSVLKRPDERHVTMQAFDNPVFVEDMVRNVTRMLADDPRIVWFKVHAENHESIHNHNAFAQITIASSDREER